MERENVCEDEFSPVPPPPPRQQVGLPAENVGAYVASYEGAKAERTAQTPSADFSQGSPNDDASARTSHSFKRRVSLSDRARAAAAALACVIVVGIGGAAVVASMEKSDAGPAAGDGSLIDEGHSSVQSGQRERSSDVAAVEESLSAQLSALLADEGGMLTDYVQLFIDEYDAGVDPELSYGFADLEISAEELTEKLRDGLSFSIESVDVYSGKAWVNVAISSKSFSRQAEEFASIMRRDTGDYADEEGYKKQLKESMLAAFDEIKQQESSMLVVIGKDENGWALSSSDVASLLGSAWYG